MSRRTQVIVGLVLCLLVLGVVFVAPLWQMARSVLRPEPPAPLTALPVALAPTALPSATPSPSATASPTLSPSQSPVPTSPPTVTPTPTITPTATPIVVQGRRYDAYVFAATKEGQAYQYSCEFDAAWVILQTFGFAVSVDDLIAQMPHDTRVEPYIEETRDGFFIHGGAIGERFSGDYTKNFLARSTGAAMRPVFEQYGLETYAVADRAGVEAALRQGGLIWMKTTVDFKPWRPAVWITPEGQQFRTVLGNDHAVVVIGFNEQVVVIRDVLGPTSSNQQRPYEYEVSWDTFLTVWAAQSNDGLAVLPPIE